MKILETERLIIREFTAEDIDSLYEMYDDEDVAKFVGTLSRDKEEETEILKAYIKMIYGFFGYGYWAVVLKENNMVVGKIGLNNREYNGETVVELGYIINAQYRHRGYAKEACRAILKYAADELETEVDCFINKDNTASVNLARSLEKCGLRIHFI